MKSLLAWGMLALALLLWSGFGYFVWTVREERAAYADAVVAASADESRSENMARLRSSIESTTAERTALEQLVRVPVIDIVEIIEQAGRHGGATNVSIGEASSAPSTPLKIGTVSVVMQADGSFVALVRTVLLLETLSVPSTVEQFEISQTGTTWHLTARIRAVADVQ